MLQSLHAECQKARRRHDLAACLLIPLAVLLWSWYSAPGGTKSSSDGYHALMYTLPVMNTVLLPIGMAMLASRLWDVEIKGSLPKLLYTLQSRRSLFAAKAILGSAEVFMIVFCELAGVLLLGYHNGYRDYPPLLQIVYFLFCTCTVSLMLFFSEMTLTILLSNPLPALCTGIAGALIGLFSAFMPTFFCYFIPWSYYIPLGSYILASWDPDTKIVVYATRNFNLPLLAWSLLLAAFFFGITWHFIRTKEV